MLSFFRRIINSRVGVIVTLGVLVVIALAFAAGDVTGLRTNGMGGLSGNDAAKVGGKAITVADLRSRVENEFEGFRQQQPTLTIQSFVAQGGLQGTLDQMISGLSFARFGADQGMAVSKRSVDGQIASIPGLQGPNGKFDPAIYQRLLAQRHLTDAQVRSEVTQQVLSDQITLPTMGARQVPQQLALPYASLLLERRSGEVAFVPTRAVGAGPAPSDADVQAYYARNGLHYSLPERRIIRYALVTPATVQAKATPTDAEIAQYYQAHRAEYLPSEKRTIESVVAADQGTAASIAAKVKAGSSIADAARAAGLEASSQSVDKTAYAGATSPAIADATFAAAQGALLGPIKAPLGYVVARVTAIVRVPGKSPAEARPTIVADLTKTKTLQQLAAVHDSMDDAVGKNSTFDEVAKDQQLAAVTTPALAASGVDPTVATAKPDPALAPVVKAAFQLEEGDAPQLVPVGQDGSFALVGVGRVLRPAPRPLADVRAAVVADLQAQRAQVAARRIADAVLAKVNRGMPISAALAGNGVALPPARPIDSTRAQLAAAGRGGAPAPLVLMFGMTQGSARLLAAPQGAGWLIVKLNTIQRADAAGKPGVVAATRSDLARLVGREYVDQFARAIRSQVGVKTDPAAISRIAADLAGGGASSD